MLILSLALSFVLGCTLALLWKRVRIIRMDIDCDYTVRFMRKNRLEAIRAIRNDDTLTPREKFEESFRFAY